MATLVIPTAYVWMTPAFVTGAPVDHTWVTTYDNRAILLPNIDSVVALRERYWFCWGSFHTDGNPGTPLRSGPVNIPFADCLVRPNADSREDIGARGTVFEYGIDGVCHQLANQVLLAAKDSVGASLTTEGANGYKVSVFFYGMYGRQKVAWDTKKRSCSSNVGGGKGDNQMTDNHDDDFDKNARRILPPARFEELKVLRKRFGFELALGSKAKINSMLGEQAAAEINESINTYLHEVAQLLSSSEFESLFGFQPDQSIELIDKKMVGSDLEHSA